MNRLNGWYVDTDNDDVHGGNNTEPAPLSPSLADLFKSDGDTSGGEAPRASSAFSGYHGLGSFSRTSGSYLYSLPSQDMPSIAQPLSQQPLQSHIQGPMLVTSATLQPRQSRQLHMPTAARAMPAPPQSVGSPALPSSHSFSNSAGHGGLLSSSAAHEYQNLLTPASAVGPEALVLHSASVAGLQENDYGQHLMGMPGSPAHTSSQKGSDDAVLDGDECVATHKEKSRLAQKRFRQRQKNKIKTWGKQVEDLSSQVALLKMDKAELLMRNRILASSLTLNTHHEERLHCNEEIMDKEQMLLLEEVAEFQSRLEQHTVSTEDVMQLTTLQVIEDVFPKYILRLKELLGACGGDPSSPAGREICELMHLRRNHEERRALFSCFYWAIYSWNSQEMADAGSPPPPSVWGHLLAGLHLSSAQEAALMAARRALLATLIKLGSQRADILSSLGMQLLQTTREEWLKCSAVRQLQNSLGQERQAVFTFYHIFCDETITPLQEAWLEAHTYPWSPDIWAMCNLLAESRDSEPAGTPPANLNLEHVIAIKPLLPLNNAFKLLVQPLPALGLGLRLKRGILADPFETVLPSSAFPVPAVASLRGMSLHDVHCGRYREVMFWDWMKQQGLMHIDVPL